MCCSGRQAHRAVIADREVVHVGPACVEQAQDRSQPSPLHIELLVHHREEEVACWVLERREWRAKAGAVRRDKDMAAKIVRGAVGAARAVMQQHRSRALNLLPQVAWAEDEVAARQEEVPPLKPAAVVSELGTHQPPAQADLHGHTVPCSIFNGKLLGADQPRDDKQVRLRGVPCWRQQQQLGEQRHLGSVLPHITVVDATARVGSTRLKAGRACEIAARISAPLLNAIEHRRLRCGSAFDVREAQVVHEDSEALSARRKVGWRGQRRVWIKLRPKGVTVGRRVARDALAPSRAQHITPVRLGNVLFTPYQFHVLNRVRTLLSSKALGLALQL